MCVFFSVGALIPVTLALFLAGQPPPEPVAVAAEPVFLIPEYASVGAGGWAPDQFSSSSLACLRARAA